MTIGESIRKSREKAGLSKKEFSVRSGYNLMAIWRIENGKTTPSIVTAIDFADVLGVSLDELVGREVKGNA